MTKVVDADTYVKKVVAEAPPLTCEQIERLRALLLITNRPVAEATQTLATGNILTAREQEVAQLIAKGMSYKEIGTTLFISDRTVQVHAQNAMRKLGMNRRSQLVRYVLTANIEGD